MHHRATTLRAILAGGLMVGALGAHHARAEGLPIRDGLWETTVQNPMTGERTNRECLKDAVLDPRSMLEGQNECEMTEEAVEGNTLTFAMACAGGSGSAQGRMSVEGDHGDGEISMQFDMGGRKMSMTMSWDAVRIGDC
jgi:Protein of unknown function (DUF3617)